MKSEINHWDNLPGDVQKMILEFRAVKTIQRNIKRHPEIRAICIAKACMERHGYNICIDITQSSECWGIEYCGKHFGKKNIDFWMKFSNILINEILDLKYFGYSISSDYNVQRCINVVKKFIKKFTDILVITKDDKINFNRIMFEIDNNYYLNSFDEVFVLEKKLEILEKKVEKNIKEYYECYPHIK